MPRHASKPLTVRFVETITEPGMYCDGGCLYLKVSGSRAKSWIVRVMIHGKRRDIGIGSTSMRSLREAREAAQAIRRQVYLGEYELRSEVHSGLTFGDAAKQHFEAQRDQWTSEKHGLVWWASLENHVFPTLRDKLLSDIQQNDLQQVLDPIWKTKYDTAKKVKQRIAGVFDWARATGHYEHENPVVRLKAAFPAPRRQPKHHAALDWRELPDFIVELRQRTELSARLTEFTILTCVRSGEARRARWSEIEGDLWSIPASRMKERRLHRVPLSTHCSALLNELPRLDDCLVFPSLTAGKLKGNRAMSENACMALIKRMGIRDVTVHGFRSTFRDWCRDNDAAAWEISEISLSHAAGSLVERAYARSDAIDRRRKLMQQWADYALSKLEPTAARKNSRAPVRTLGTKPRKVRIRRA